MHELIIFIVLYHSIIALYQSIIYPWSDIVSCPIAFFLSVALVIKQECCSLMKTVLFQIFVPFCTFSLILMVVQGVACAKYDWLGQNFPFCICFGAIMLLHLPEISQSLRYCEYGKLKFNLESRIPNTQLERMYLIFRVISEKTLCRKDFTSSFRDTFI